MLKRTLAGVVVAGLLLGAGAVNATGSAFPGNADEGSTMLPALSTYADQHRGKPVQTTGSAFPGNADEGSNQLPALSTYADRYRGVQHAEAASAVPASNATD